MLVHRRARRRGAGIEVGILLELLHALFALALVHRLLEAFDRRAQVGADAAKALGAENHQRDRQDHQQHF